jgi:hypothetical protein
MLSVRFTEKVLPVVAGWVSGSVVTWMVIDNEHRNEKKLNKAAASQLGKEAGVVFAASETDSHAVPSRP